MATFTNTVIPVSTAAQQFYTWAHPIAAFLSTAGWLQQPDTGQIVWPASIFNITDANGNGTTVTFTGTITNGTTPLRVGMQIKVSGTTNFGTAGTPILYTVTGGNLTTTWTALSATTAHDAAIAANTGWGMVYVQPTMTAVTGTGSVATYTYSNTDGILCPGQSIVIPSAGTTGFTNTGFNGTFTITSVTATTFTVVNGTNASETKTVTGTVATTTGVISTSESTNTTFPPATGSVLYEIWKMSDSNGFPIFLRIGYSTGASGATIPELLVGIAASTDGAGTLTGGNTGNVVVTNTNATSAAATASYMSGSTNRLSMALWTTAVAGAGGKGFFNIERSHDSGGVDTTSYATLSVVGGVSNSITNVQNSITTSGVTTTETKLPCIIVRSTGTGSFGASTILSPVFPVVGAVGNPCIGALVGKSIDWTDQTQFTFTMYNTSHNYIIFNSTLFGTAGLITYDTSATAALAMRYE